MALSNYCALRICSRSITPSDCMSMHGDNKCTLLSALLPRPGTIAILCSIKFIVIINNPAMQEALYVFTSLVEDLAFMQMYRAERDMSFIAPLFAARSSYDSIQRIIVNTHLQFTKYLFSSQNVLGSEQSRYHHPIYQFLLR